jgi:hypothetical protein
MLVADEFAGAQRVVAHCGFMTRQPEGTREGCQSVGVIVNEEEMRFAGQIVPFAELRAVQSVAVAVCACSGARSAAGDFVCTTTPA